VIIGDFGPGANPRRYVVCFNPQEAKRDAAAREAILHSLADKLDHGDKALVSNHGYRRFLATQRDGHFKIDPDRVAEDARFDGIYILRTNAKLNTLSVALSYRQLWRVESIFRTAKSILETRPIFHHCDDTIAGHLFCSFLALVLRKELDERLAAAGYDPEWGDVLHDLDRVEEVTVEQNNKRFILRAQAPGCFDEKRKCCSLTRMSVHRGQSRCSRFLIRKCFGPLLQASPHSAPRRHPAPSGQAGSAAARVPAI